MDDLDRALWEAWCGRTSESKSTKKWVGAALRSWCLVLRANDRRLVAGELVGHVRFMRKDGKGWIGEEVGQWKGENGWEGWGEWGVVEAFDLDGGEIKYLCGHVRIDWPGVTVKAAAEAFGVNVGTIRNWEKRGLVRVRDAYEKGVHEEGRICGVGRRFPKLNYRLVTTKGWIDGGGEVWSGWWGRKRRMLVDRIDEGMKVGRLVRGRRRLSEKVSVWMWMCPACEGWVYKLYCEIGVFQMGELLGGSGCAGLGDKHGRFVCRKCAEVVYESAERGSVGGSGKKVDVWDRFVGRISGGELKGDEVVVLVCHGEDDCEDDGGDHSGDGEDCEHGCP